MECRWGFVVAWGSGTAMCVVCIDLLRSLRAAAFGFRRLSSLETLGSMSSKLALSRVGEVAGVEPRDVMSVR